MDNAITRKINEYWEQDKIKNHGIDFIEIIHENSFKKFLQSQLNRELELGNGPIEYKHDLKVSKVADAIWKVVTDMESGCGAFVNIVIIEDNLDVIEDYLMSLKWDNDRIANLNVWGCRAEYNLFGNKYRSHLKELEGENWKNVLISPELWGEPNKEQY